MIPVQYEICDAPVEYGEVEYVRPIVVLSNVVNGRFSAALISSALDLYEGPQNHFLIEDTDPDFAATGLTRTSYVACEEIIEVRLETLVRRRGRFDGALFNRFKQWIG